MKISIPRLGRILADAEAAYAASRAASEEVRRISTALQSRRIERDRLGPDEHQRRSELATEVAALEAAMEAAEHDAAHASGVVSVAGGLRGRAVAFMREKGINLPAHIEEKIR